MIGARSGMQLLALLAATGVLALAACSGSGDSASATETEPAGQEASAPPPAGQAAGGGFRGGFTQLDETQINALAACMEGRGFEVPDGASTLQELFGGGLPSAELQEALQDCGNEVGVSLPGGFGGGGFGGGRGGFGGGGFGGGFTPLDQAQIGALAACLEGRGFEVPDGASTLQELFGGGPPSAELREALQGCGNEVGVSLPGGFAGGGFGGRGGSQ